MTTLNDNDSESTTAAVRLIGMAAYVPTTSNDNETPSADEVAPLAHIAAYIRWSAPDQHDGYSKEAQLRAIKEDLARRGLRLDEAHIDDVRSDTSQKTRASFARRLDDAEASDVDYVVGAQLDRFARNLNDVLKQKDLAPREGSDLEAHRDNN